uniref:Uncharacterized protein n=1 Tax=Desulfacinum infernum TaxID=35837 RepID=A0A832A133_9BACT
MRQRLLYENPWTIDAMPRSILNNRDAKVEDTLQLALWAATLNNAVNRPFKAPHAAGESLEPQPIPAVFYASAMIFDEALRKGEDR